MRIIILSETNGAPDKDASGVLLEIDKQNTGETKMSKKTLVPNAQNALDQFKMQAASEVGVNLTNGYNGNLTSKEAGSVGGQMVKKMIEKYENDIATK